MKLVIYARVSSQEQVSGYSLDAQVDLCRKWASEHGHEVSKTFIEFGKSARTDKRPAFQSAIHFVLAGGSEGVLVHKSDRFARNLLDYLTYQDMLKAKDKRILSVCEEFLNDDSPESNFVSKVIGAVSEYVSDNIGREAQKGRNQKANSGSWPGSIPPFGYVREDRFTIVPHQEKAAHVRLAFREFATGQYTLIEWANKAFELGITSEAGKKMFGSAWQRIFRSKFYLGKFDWKGEEIIGDHVAIIAQSDFDKVNDLLTANDSGGTKNRHFWLLAGLLWSEPHNAPMHGTTAKKNFTYYRINDHHVNAPEMEARVIGLLEKCRGYTDHAPEALRIALKVAPSLNHVYQFLVSDHARRDLLRLVFVDNGLTVSWGGAVVTVKFKLGFDFV